MPALNFKKEFAAAVESGKKRQTIRAERKRPIVAGDILYLYVGLRTRGCRRLMVGTCTAVTPVVIDDEMVNLNGVMLRNDARQNFARADGFENWHDMRDWFQKQRGLPFHGSVIEWEASI